LQDSKFVVCQTLITCRTIAICWHCGRNNGTGFSSQKNMPFYEVLWKQCIDILHVMHIFRPWLWRR
jgi:hypothetical protein